MAARKPKIEYYWSSVGFGDHKVNWRLVSANGEVMCSSTQGFRDKADAKRSVQAVMDALTGCNNLILHPRAVGPGKKPQ